MVFDEFVNENKDAIGQGVITPNMAKTLISIIKDEYELGIDAIEGKIGDLFVDILLYMYDDEYQVGDKISEISTACTMIECRVFTLDDNTSIYNITEEIMREQYENALIFLPYIKVRIEESGDRLDDKWFNLRYLLDNIYDLLREYARSDEAKFKLNMTDDIIASFEEQIKRYEKKIAELKEYIESVKNGTYCHSNTPPQWYIDKLNNDKG
jgi:hypothetical protein